MEEKDKMIIVELKKRSSVTLPTVFDDDYFKEHHNLYCSDCKPDLMNNRLVLKEDCLYEE